MPEQQQKAKAKGKKIGRNKKHQAVVYRTTGRLEKNAKRRLMRHVRSNPGDASAAAVYEATYGKAASLGLNGRGRKLRKRLDAEARAAA